MVLFLDEEDREPAPLPEFEWPARESDDQRLLRHYVTRHTRFNPVLSRFITDLTSAGATLVCRVIAVSLYLNGTLLLDELFIEPRL